MSDDIVSRNDKIIERIRQKIKSTPSIVQPLKILGESNKPNENNINDQPVGQDTKRVEVRKIDLTKSLS